MEDNTSRGQYAEVQMANVMCVLNFLSCSSVVDFFPGRAFVLSPSFPKLTEAAARTRCITLDHDGKVAIGELSSRSCPRWSSSRTSLDEESRQASCPLVISPRSQTSVSRQFLVQWLETNRSSLHEQLLEHGAILVRGFDLATAADMEAAVLAFVGSDTSLHREYRGTSPRRLQPGCQYMFSAADVPTYFAIPQHIEMSYMPSVPRYIFFGCVTAPDGGRSSGGETALADFRQVYRALPETLREKLQRKGVRHIRIHPRDDHDTSWLSRFDVSNNSSWRKLFGTDSMEKVDEICAKDGLQHAWYGTSIVLTSYTEAFHLHPVTREPVYFNHLQVFHNTTFPVELLLSWWRMQDHRLLLHFLAMAAFCFIKYLLLGHRMGLHATYGDGEEFSWMDLYHIRRVIHQSMVYPRWEKGDVLLVDNFSISHGRQPTFHSNRNVVVAWSEPEAKGNLTTTKNNCNQSEQ